MAGDVEALGRELAVTVLGLPEIAGMSSGPFGTISMPVPGGRVEGVVVRGDSVQIGVVARLGRSLPETAAEVREAVLPLVPDRRVHVSIEDVALEDTATGPANTAPPSAAGRHGGRG